MRITRLSLALIALVVAGGFTLLLDQSLRDLGRETFQATEETMVDLAEIVAAVVAEESAETGKLDPGVLRAALPVAMERELAADIFQFRKTRVGCRIYVTDAAGLVIYDSDEGRLEGTSLADMRDVALTLAGEYGARSSRTVLDDEKTSVLHVAAPVLRGEEILGVVTVRKAKLDQWPFIVERRNKVIFSTVLIGGGILLFCAAVLFWVMRPIRLLTEYVRAVAGGKRVPLPELGSGLEVNTLGTALEGMRDELEGRDYATDFVQTVTHELKSPLAAIRGAAELLQEPGMAAEDRTRFLESLRRESDRAERLLRQLLRLSEVERRRELRDVREVAVEEVVRAAMDEVKGGAERRRVTLELTLNKDARLRAEPMLLRRALVNVLENAIDFSPPGGPVRVEVETEGAEVMIEVRDAGPGFPEYALKRVFERFYSLKQEQAGVKGTGLGLCLVREAMLLHGGTVEVENAEPTGAVVTLRLPVGG